MSPSDATLHMHRRLHAGASRLRALPTITADAPPALARGRFDGCAACTEANAARLPHESHLYKPSHAGRLIHTVRHCRSLCAHDAWRLPVRTYSRG
eukprot:6183720-Pleurochrysis_carterae.AAC.1